ncbi:hypothetical protein JXD38_11765, partial [candidate division WOR-3 bacterium]|nr:hypothetical protein [candidate division WOR-3 bacterium]
VNLATAAPHILWQGQDANGTARMVHAYRNGAGWQPRDTVSEPGLQYGQGTGQIEFTPDGTGHAVWEGESDSFPTVGQIRYSRRSLAGTWSVPENITAATNTRERPSIANGGNSASPFDLHVVWSDYRDGNSEIYYKHDSLVTAISDDLQPRARSLRPMASIVRGVLVLGGVDSRQHPAQRAEMLDAAGRKVSVLRPGVNDVSGLAAGVYFVCPASGVMRDASSVKKVVIQK